MISTQKTSKMELPFAEESIDGTLSCFDAILKRNRRTDRIPISTSRANDVLTRAKN